MGIEQAFSDQTLLDVVSLLSARNESGRLKFAGGTMRGAFFFSKGKLVDAHLGPFSGFQAVNLAISVGKASLSFDPSIESHSSSFKVPAERLLLKERFGIETAGLETAKLETAKPEILKPETPKPEAIRSEVPDSEKILATTPLRRGVDRQLSAVTGHSPPDPPPDTRPLSPDTRHTSPTLPEPLPQQVESETSVPVQETEIRKAIIGSPEEFLLRVISDSSSRRNRVLLMCMMFLVVIPATVGLASYWSNSAESNVRKFSPAKTPETLPVAAAVPAPSQPEETLTKTRPADEPIPLRPQPSPVTAEKPTQESDTNRLDPAPAKDNEVAKVSLDPPVAPPESAKPLSRTIAVVVEIEEGRVTEAFIKQPQRELAAYEATALRLARQRRFPKGTTRRETINLPVTREQ